MQKNNLTINRSILVIISKLIFAFVLLLQMKGVIAANEADISFPHGCEKTGYSFKYQTLLLHPYAAGRSQSLYLMHNKTLKNLKLYQMRTGNEPYVMHLNNKIYPNQWGMFATDEKKVKFICTIVTKKSRYGDIVPCKNVIELCEYTNAKFSINNHGNYWAVSSGSKKYAIYNVIHQGVWLKW